VKAKGESLARSCNRLDGAKIAVQRSCTSFKVELVMESAREVEISRM
jgi:hypothetical protein